MFSCITRCYERFRLMSYRGLFRLLRERDGSLSATEAFAVDVIYLLRGPTGVCRLHRHLAAQRHL